MTEASRRDFLKAAAALAAVHPPSMQGSEAPEAPPRSRPLAPDEPVNLAVIGTGGMGTGHTEGLLSAAKDGRANIRVVGLADVCEPRLLAAKQKVEDVQGADSCRVYAQYRDLLKRPDLHGVLIASPAHWHADMLLDAMKAGKDGYVEKPMTRWLCI